MGVESLSPARILARTVITRVRERQAYAHETLQAALRSASLDSRNRAFATRLAYGTIAVRGTLDELVFAELSDPERTPEVALDVLALSSYELFFEKTDAYIAVDQGVRLMTKCAPRCTGFANAVLRRLAQKRDCLFPGGDPLTDARAQARLYGHPRWLATYFRQHFGVEEAGRLMATNNTPAPLYLIDLLQDTSASTSALTPDAGLTSLGIDSLTLPGAYIASKPTAFWALSPSKRRGLAAMDFSAQTAVSLARVQAGQTVVEIGCGRGSKSLALAAAARRTGGRAEVWGVDLHSFKVNKAKDIARSLGKDEVSFVTADATQKTWEKELGMLGAKLPAHIVFVDAPCTGLGTLRRVPDKRWRLQEADIKSAAALGLRLLTQAATLLARGGTLLYATCTITAQENQDQIAAFLASPQGSAFEIDPIEREELPAELSHARTEEGYFATFPQEGAPDGHFVARLRRKN